MRMQVVNTIFLNSKLTIHLNNFLTIVLFFTPIVTGNVEENHQNPKCSVFTSQRFTDQQQAVAYAKQNRAVQDLQTVKNTRMIFTCAFNWRKNVRVKFVTLAYCW